MSEICARHPYSTLLRPRTGALRTASFRLRLPEGNSTKTLTHPQLCSTFRRNAPKLPIRQTACKYQSITHGNCNSRLEYSRRVREKFALPNRCLLRKTSRRLQNAESIEWVKL